MTASTTTTRICRSYNEAHADGMSHASPVAPALARRGDPAALTRGAARARGGAQIVGSANPDAALEGLEANPQRFGPASRLGAADNLAIGEIGLDQVDQRGAGLAGVRRRQRVGE